MLFTFPFRIRRVPKCFTPFTLMCDVATSPFSIRRPHRGLAQTRFHLYLPFICLRSRTGALGLDARTLQGWQLALQEATEVSTAYVSNRDEDTVATRVLMARHALCREDVRRVVDEALTSVCLGSVGCSAPRRLRSYSEW